MEKAEEEAPLRVPLAQGAVMAVSVLVTLGMGIFPSPFTAWTQAIASAVVR